MTDTELLDEWEHVNNKLRERIDILNKNVNTLSNRANALSRRVDMLRDLNKLLGKELKRLRKKL